MATQVVQNQPQTNALSAFLQFWDDVKAIAGAYWYPTKPGERAFLTHIPDFFKKVGDMLFTNGL